MTVDKVEELVARHMRTVQQYRGKVPRIGEIIEVIRNADHRAQCQNVRAERHGYIRQVTHLDFRTEELRREHGRRKTGDIDPSFFKDVYDAKYQGEEWVDQDAYLKDMETLFAEWGVEVPRKRVPRKRYLRDVDRRVVTAKCKLVGVKLVSKGKQALQWTLERQHARAQALASASASSAQVPLPAVQGAKSSSQVESEGGKRGRESAGSADEGGGGKRAKCKNL